MDERKERALELAIEAYGATRSPDDLIVAATVFAGWMKKTEEPPVEFRADAS